MRINRGIKETEVLNAEWKEDEDVRPEDLCLDDLNKCTLHLRRGTIDGVPYEVVNFRQNERGRYLYDGIYGLKGPDGKVVFGEIIGGRSWYSHDLTPEFILIGDLEVCIERIETKKMILAEKAIRELRRIFASVIHIADQDAARQEART